MKPSIIVITGPTGAGKSELGLRLALELQGEIICADSLTIYRGLNIGSAKPSDADRDTVPHHLLDLAEPTDPFSAADFRTAATAAIFDITARGKRPILVGGSGLYLRTLLHGLNQAPGEDSRLRSQLQQKGEQLGAASLLAELRSVDPQTAARLHERDIFRIIRALEVYHTTGRPISDFHAEHRFAESPFNTLQFCLDLPRESLYRRIELRVDRMLADGLLDEVKQLLASAVPPDCKPLCAIGYKEVVAYLQVEYDYTEMVRLIKQNSRRFAKRQLTWFRKEPELQWISYPQDAALIFSAAKRFFQPEGG